MIDASDIAATSRAVLKTVSDEPISCNKFVVSSKRAGFMLRIKVDSPLLMG
jgi:hypothetical protein